MITQSRSSVCHISIDMNENQSAIDIMNAPQVGALFDTSILDTKTLSDEEFKNYLVNQVQTLLNQEFPETWQKRKLKVCRDRIQCACPVCRDSMKELSKKRGNFILSGKFAGKFKCFNCNSFMSINKLFERFHIPLSLDSLDYIAAHQTSLDSFSNFSVNASTNINSLFDLELINEYAIDKQKFISAFNLLTCSANDFHKGATYIKSRHLNNYGNYLYEPNSNVLFILNLVDDTKFIGFQIRRLNPRKGQSKYQTYSLKSIHKYFFKNENIEIPDSLDILSMMFNIFQININSPILVTEGPLDAFFLPNCIATTGANKSLQLDLPFWFVYDSDKTGNEHAIERINQGYHVFLWDNLKRDLGLPKRDKWDISDVIDYCIKNRLQIPNWRMYFSRDNWDLLDI